MEYIKADENKVRRFYKSIEDRFLEKFTEWAVKQESSKEDPYELL